jgi:hypothetical protein
MSMKENSQVGIGWIQKISWVYKNGLHQLISHINWIIAIIDENELYYSKNIFKIFLQ